MMKRIALGLMPLFLLTLAGCADMLSSAQLASAVQTLTATVLPPTPTATPDPDESTIVILLNRGLEQTVDPLSQTVDARYQVVDASFPLGADQQASTFRVDVRCECTGSSCCTPERTFVVIVNAMRPGIEKIARQVPASVMDVQVTCLDHNATVGMVIASWQDLKNYFAGAINGFQLGGRVFTLAGP